MKKIISKVKAAKSILAAKTGSWFVDHAAAIIIIVVIAILLMGTLYLLWGNTILPGITQKINDLFGWS